MDYTERIRSLAQAAYNRAMEAAQTEVELDTLESYREYFSLIPYREEGDFRDTESMETPLEESARGSNPFKSERAYNMFNTLTKVREGIAKVLDGIKVTDGSK